MAASASVVAPVLDSAIVHEKPNPAADKMAANTPPTQGVRIVGPTEYKEVARCLAEAFREDHAVRYAIDTPDRAHWSEEQKLALFQQKFEYIVYASCLAGLVTTVGPDYDCCALWNPPGTSLDGFLTLCRSGLWRLHYQFSSEGRARFFGELLPLLSRTFDDVLGGRTADTWYLNYIGTKPGSRGKGYARSLIEHVTARADRDNQPCYLESSHEVNIAIYTKLGFAWRRPIFLERGEEKIKLDIMVREPGQVKAERRRVKKHFGNFGLKGE